MQLAIAALDGSYSDMADEDSPRAPENPMFIAAFRLAVPALLGAILTYAASISSAQTELNKSVYGMQGQLATIVQQSSDYGNRLAKVERSVEENRRALSTDESRLSVIEARRIR